MGSKKIIITNNQKRIKYFTYYGCNDPLRQRDNSPAADSKIDYIITALNRCDYSVDLISIARSSCNNFIRGCVERKGSNTIRYFASIGKTASLFRVFNHLFMDIQFFVWCLLNLKKREQVIVYHSLGYDSIFIRLFLLKKIRIIGEIEEIYQDVSKQAASRCRNEYRFIDICEKYIFPTHLIDQKFNKSHKPSLVVHGVYAAENTTEKKLSDGKIHVVYGGTLDPNKGGATAAAAAEFLPSNYHVHICGFGDSAQIQDIVTDTQAKSESTVTFDGEMKGDDYKHFIQKCHIGLSTQDPNAAFNSTSFPSKILVYLTNGLKVVSIRIPAIEQSAVAGSLIFYDTQTPEKIAEAIMCASKENECGNEILKKLDERFCEDLYNLLSR